MTLRQLTDADVWNRFVSSHPTGSILQSYEWGDVKSGSWTPFRLGLLDKDRLVAGALVLKRQLPFGKSILYSPRGPLFSSPEFIGDFFRHLRKWSEPQGALLYKCDPEIEEQNKSFKHQLSEQGLVGNPENIQPRATIILDLTVGADSLLKSFHHKTRYNIRLSEKKGVQIKQHTGSDAIEVFYRLFEITSERDRFMILKRSYFDHLWDTLNPKGYCAVFAAYYEGEPLAAILQTIFGGRMTYLYGASSNTHRNLMPNHLVHWRAIEWALGQGLKTYDLWGIPSNPREGHPLWGVYRFKKGFSETETRWIGTFDLVFRPVTHKLFGWGIHTAKSIIRWMRTGNLSSSLEE